MTQKRNMILVVAWLCFLTGLTACSADTVRYFRESFDSPVRLPGWKMQSGWTLRDGTLRRNGIGGFEAVTFGEAEWQNYEVEFKARRRQIRVEDQHWGIILRDGGKAPVHLLFRGERAAWISDSGETTFGIPLSRELDVGENARWTSFRVTLRGHDLALSIDNQEIGHIQVPKNGFGKCTIYAYGVDLEIDDLYVCVLPASTSAETAAVEKSIKPVDSPNLLLNSGFELSTLDNSPDYWGCPHWGIGDADAILNYDKWAKHFCTVTEGAYEGKRCMRIVNEYNGPVSSAYLLRSCNVRSKPGTTYTLSAWMRSDRNQLPVKLGSEIVRVTQKWQRYSVRFVNAGNSLYDDMINIEMQRAGILWIDAVQLEEGTTATTYRPASAERRLLVHDGNTEKKLYNVPRHRLPYKNQEIAIDGRLNEPVWRSLPPLPMGNLDAQGVPALKTDAYIWCNDKGLYVGIKCWGKSGACSVTERDGYFWKDPCVELFIDSKFSRSFYHHFAVTKDNVQYDSFCLMPSWNGDWKSGTYKSADGQYWSAEIFIPFGILDIGLENQEIWGFNLGRSEDNKSVCWAPTYGSFHNPLRFGQLAVNLELQKKFLFHIADLQALRKNAGKAQISFAVVNDTAQTANLTVHAEIDGQLQQQSLTSVPGRKSRVELDFSALQPENRSFPVKLTVTENGILRTVAEASLTVPQMMKAQLQYQTTDMPEMQLAVWTMLPPAQAKKTTIVAVLNGKRITAPIHNELTIIRLPTSGIGPEGGAVTVSLIEAGNRVLAKKVLHFSKIAKGENSVFCDRFSRMIAVKGKPFLPVGFSWEGEINPKVIEHLARIGCTSICLNMWAYDDKTLQSVFDSAAKHGVYIKAVMDGRDVEKCQTLIRRFKNHPALLAWNVFDEVFTIPWGQENYSTVSATIEKLKKLDPHHPVLINENAWGMQYIQKKGWKFPGDIVSIDHYAWTENPNYAFYADLADQMNTLGEEELRPSWIYLLGAGYAFHVRRDHTAKEHRFMAYSCIIHGISGIYYFADYPKSHSALEAVRKNFREFTVLTPILANRLQKAPAVRCTASEIDYTVRVYKGFLYIIALNKSPDLTVTPQFLFDGCEKNKTIKVMFEDRMITAESGLFVDSFKGWQPHVYQIPFVTENNESKRP